MKEAPFLRLVVPFIGGIAVDYYYNISFIIISAGIAGCCIGILFPLSLFFRLRYAWIASGFINGFLFFTGCLINSSHRSDIAVEKLKEISALSLPIVVTIQEPPVEKSKSWKTLATVETDPSVDINIYFKKDSIPPVAYGDRIAFIAPLKDIVNITAYGSFDYKKYCALKNIHFQVFLRPGQYTHLDRENDRWLNAFLFSSRDRIAAILNKYIEGKKQSGLAEALLIGYKDNLDKELIKAYSTTGVIHVVAISGMHLGLIYVLLRYICFWFSKRSLGKWFSLLIIVGGLWLFSLLTGASASVMRSAVMFTFIVTGEAVHRHSSIFNNLSASAFLLLCYDPYWLWDIGFQLSYIAIVSIVLFQKPVYSLFIVKNKLIDACWKLAAVTLSAQILTTPLCIFYFAQFPNLFLIANFIAIPLSNIILFAEIILCTVSFLPALASIAGKIIYYLILLMNSSIEYINHLPFSTTGDLHINFSQLVVMYAFIVFISLWLIRKEKYFLFPSLITVLIYVLLR